MQYFKFDIGYLGTFDKGFLCSLLVRCLSLPCSKSRGLESTAIREAHLPGSVQGKLVHGVQIQRGLLFTLTTREEADAWEPEERSWAFEKRLNGGRPLMTYQVQQLAQCVWEQLLLPWRPPEGCTSWCRSVQQWPCLVWAEFPPDTHGGQRELCTQPPGPWLEILGVIFDRLFGFALTALTVYSGRMLTFSVAYWHRCRSWSPSGRISGSTMGTKPF